MSAQPEIPEDLHGFMRGGADRIRAANLLLNQLRNLQVQLALPGDTRNGRAPIQFSGTNALLAVPTDPRVSMIINSLQNATLTGKCNGDGTITCTLTIPHLPQAY